MALAFWKNFMRKRESYRKRDLPSPLSVLPSVQCFCEWACCVSTFFLFFCHRFFVTVPVTVPVYVVTTAHQTVTLFSSSLSSVPEHYSSSLRWHLLPALLILLSSLCKRRDSSSSVLFVDYYSIYQHKLLLLLLPLLLFSLTFNPSTTFLITAFPTQHVALFLKTL